MEKFALAALGSIPWVGGFISAAASMKTDDRDLQQETLQTRWLEEHTTKMRQLEESLENIWQRFESLGERIDERIQSKEYLALVAEAFRTWDSAETEEKRGYVRNLIANAAGTRVCSDDVVRLFIDWLNLYHEAHFAVIREVHQNPGATRYDVWSVLYGDVVREDSAEADLFKLLFRDLSAGGVIRQERETTSDGRFVRKRPPARRSGVVSSTMESAFEDTKPYEVTELGRQFVHYTMNEVVQQIGGEAQPRS